jgi:hypothetical protein
MRSLRNHRGLRRELLGMKSAAMKIVETSRGDQINPPMRRAPSSQMTVGSRRGLIPWRGLSRRLERKTHVRCRMSRTSNAPGSSAILSRRRSPITGKPRNRSARSLRAIRNLQNRQLRISDGWTKERRLFVRRLSYCSEVRLSMLRSEDGARRRLTRTWRSAFSWVVVSQSMVAKRTLPTSPLGSS